MNGSRGQKNQLSVLIVNQGNGKMDKWFKDYDAYKPRKKKIKKHYSFWIILLVLMIGLIIFSVVSSVDEVQESGGDVIKSIEEKEEVSKRNIIPRTDYTCEEILPEEVTVLIYGDRVPFLRDTLLKNNETLNSRRSYCRFNERVGQKSTVFKCRGSYSVFGELDENSIILRNYKVIYEFEFDRMNCVRNDQFVNLNLDCPIDKFSCSWSYTN